MELEEAKSLTIGSTVYHTVQKNADGTAQRWKVTSVKIWKRSPDRVLVGLKHGLYSYDTANENDIQFITRVEPLPVVKAKKPAIKKSPAKRQDYTVDPVNVQEIKRAYQENLLKARIDAETIKQAHDQMDSAEELRGAISYAVYLRTYDTFLNLTF